MLLLSTRTRATKRSLVDEIRVCAILFSNFKTTFHRLLARAILDSFITYPSHDNTHVRIDNAVFTHTMENMKVLNQDKTHPWESLFVCPMVSKPNNTLL